MSHYASILGEMSPTTSAAAKIAGIVEALTPPPSDGSAMVVAKPAPTKSILSFLPIAAGAAAGAMLFPKHRVLGILGGGAAVHSATRFLKGDTQGAMFGIAVEAAAIGGALYMKKNPVLGYGLGLVGGTLATAAFSPSSPQRGLISNLWKELT